MNISLQISLLIGIVFFAFIIIHFLKRKSINLNYSIIWILTAIALLIIDFFPNIINGISKLFGIEAPSNALFVIFIFFILLVLFSLTTIVSKQHNQIKVLVQELAILRKKFDESSSADKISGAK